MLLLVLGSPAEAQSDPSPGRSLGDGVFTAEQAERGRSIFTGTCSACHMPQQFGDGVYLMAWQGQSVGALFEFVRTRMPYDNPGKLKRREYADVLAYIFSLNGLPAGDAEMKSDRRSLEEILIEAPPASGGGN